MVSSNEVGLDLREKKPPPPVGRYQATTLCSQNGIWGAANEPKGKSLASGYRSWSCHSTSIKAPIGHLTILSAFGIPQPAAWVALITTT
jgi:hypothetical protein